MGIDNKCELVKLYGPTAKQDILFRIMRLYFTADNKKFKVEFSKINNKNIMLNGNWDEAGFIYQGEVYTVDTDGDIVELNEKLFSEMDSILPRYEQLQMAKRDVNAYLRKLLTISNTIADIRLLINKELIDCLPEEFDPYIEHSRLTINKEQQDKFLKSTENLSGAAKAYRFYEALFTGED